MNELRGTFARYDGDEIRTALFATMDLFRRLTTEASDRLELRYDADADAYATALVRELLAGH